jgi:spoIIIJ-associated protein
MVYQQETVRRQNMPIEKEARSAEEAIQEICKELGKERDELEFEVIEEKTRGIFGLMGNKRVKVKATLKTEDRNQKQGEEVQDREKKVRDRGGKKQEAGDDALTYAKTVLERVVGGIIDSATVEGRIEGGTIYLNIKGDGSGLLIGRHGQTLDAIQYIVGRIVGKQLGEKRMVVVDTERYRERRKENLEQLAQRMGEKAKSIGRPVSLPPMSASDRRIVHLALKNDREIETRSEGEGGLKNIKIIPRKRGS